MADENEVEHILEIHLPGEQMFLEIWQLSLKFGLYASYLQ